MYVLFIGFLVGMLDDAPVTCGLPTLSFSSFFFFLLFIACGLPTLLNGFFFSKKVCVCQFVLILFLSCWSPL